MKLSDQIRDHASRVQCVVNNVQTGVKSETGKEQGKDIKNSELDRKIRRNFNTV
jgi:hypothetical protein